MGRNEGLNKTGGRKTMTNHDFFKQCAGVPKEYARRDVLPRGEAFQYRCLACRTVTTRPALQCECGGYLLIGGIVKVQIPKKNRRRR